MQSDGRRNTGLGRGKGEACPVASLSPTTDLAPRNGVSSKHCVQACRCGAVHVHSVLALALEARAVRNLVRSKLLWQHVKRRVAEVDWNSAGRLEKQVKYLFKGNWLLLQEAQNLCMQLLLARLEVISSERLALREAKGPRMDRHGCLASIHSLGDVSECMNRYESTLNRSGSLRLNPGDNRNANSNKGRTTDVKNFPLWEDIGKSMKMAQFQCDTDEWCVDIRMEKSGDLYYPRCYDMDGETQSHVLQAASRDSTKSAEHGGVVPPDVGDKSTKKRRFAKARAFFRM